VLDFYVILNISSLLLLVTQQLHRYSLVQLWWLLPKTVTTTQACNLRHYMDICARVKLCNEQILGL